MTEIPMHGDIWMRMHVNQWFTVMTVCGRHDPPHVTGYWHTAQTRDSIDPCAPGAIPLPRFLKSFELVERENFDD